MSEDLFRQTMDASKVINSNGKTHELPADSWNLVIGFEEWMQEFIPNAGEVRDCSPKVVGKYDVISPVGKFTIKNVGEKWLVEMARAIPEEKFRTLFAMYRVEAEDD